MASSGHFGDPDEIEDFVGRGELENDSYELDEDRDGSEIDRDELEIALYSQIHFESNDNIETELLETSGVTNIFKIDVKGNGNTGFQVTPKTADFVENELINFQYETTPQNNSEVSADKSVTAQGKDISFERLDNRLRPDANDKTDKKGEYLGLVQKSKTKTKSRYSKTYADKLMLGRSMSESDSLDDEMVITSKDSGSDEDWVVLDSEGSGDDNSSLFVNVNKEQQSLLNREVGEDWKIDIDDGKSGRVRPRYYKPIGVRCQNCTEIGHLSKNCPKPKKERVCIFCSETGHMFRNCPDSFCYKCDEPGHISTECSTGSSGFKTCNRCRMKGHRRTKCPDQWRQYHRTIEGKKLIRAKKRRRDDNMFCYNCAADDHLGHECDEERMDRYSKPTYPFVCQYLSLEFDMCSREEAESPAPRRNEDYRKSFNEKKRVSKYSIHNKMVPESMGRNNFDKLLLSSDRSPKESSRSKGEFKKFRKDELKSFKTDSKLSKKRHIEYDSCDSPKRLKTAGKEESNRASFKEYVSSKSDNFKVKSSQKEDEKKKFKKVKKAKTFDIEFDNYESPKRQKSAGKGDITKVPVKESVSSKKDKVKVSQRSGDDKKFSKVKNGRTNDIKSDDYECVKGWKRADKNEVSKTSVKESVSSKRDKIKLSHRGDDKKEFSNIKKAKTLEKVSKKKSAYGVPTENKSQKYQVSHQEEDLPRKDSKLKHGRKRDEINVRFKNEHTSVYTDRKIIKIKTDTLDSIDETDEDHQVFHNEWWNGEGGKSKSKKRKRKQI